MDVPVETGYQPPPGFMEDKRDPLIDLNLTDSNELWLIQWPMNLPPDFEGQQVSLNLQSDGHLGTFEGSSGKSYDVVSCKSQGPETMVFLSSASEAKIAGKISRRVSLIHYPEASELERRKAINWGPTQRASAASSTMSGRRTETPARSSRPRKNSHTTSGRTKSTVSGSWGHSKPSEERRVGEHGRSASHSGQDSGKGISDVTSTGSLGHSEERKSKKKKK